VVIDSEAPAMLQPLNVPVSNPPLVTTVPPALLTVSDTVVEWVALVPVPLTVTEYVPAGVVDEVEIVIVEDPPAVTAVGLNDTVAPEGKPLALKDTVCADPLVTAVLIVEVPDDPCVTVTLDGLAEIEKSLAGADVETVTSSNNVYVGSAG
jgi:hypothetical protein